MRKAPKQVPREGFETWLNRAKEAQREKNYDEVRRCYQNAYFNASNLADSLWNFSKKVVGRDVEGLVDDRRREFADFVTQDHPRKMLQAARGSWKSSIAVVDYSAWLVGRDYLVNNGESRIRILLASETEELAKRNLRGIRQIMEWREQYVELAGNHRPERDFQLWGKTNLTSGFRKDPTILEPTISVMGLDTARTGFHYDVIICFDPEAWVYTADGLRRVKELRLGDKLLTHEGRYRPVTGLANRQAKERVEVKIRGAMGFPHVVTSDHEYLTPQGWIRAGDLRPGDSVRRPFHGAERYPCPIPDDPELWWVLGWWVAEGSIISQRRLSFAIHAKEVNTAAQFTEILGRYSQVSDYVYYPKNSRGATYQIKGIAPWIVDYCKNRLYRGPFRKNIPAELYSLSRESRIAFLRGLWQGDGTARKEPSGKWTGNITSSSEEIIAGATQLLWDLGVSCSAHVTNQNRTYRVFFGKGVLELLSPGNCPKQKKNLSPRSISPWAIVSSVDPLGPGEVVSVSVAEDHSIAMPGAITHNCDDLEAERTSASRDLIDSCWEFYRLLLSILTPGGTLLIVGTRWHPEDIYAKIEEQNTFLKDNRKVKILTIPSDDGEGLEIGNLNFPNVLTKEELEAFRDSQGPRIFNCQYRLRPHEDEEAAFKKDWIRFVSLSALKNKRLNVYVTCDFAWTEKSATDFRRAKKPDFTVVETWAVDDDYHYHCLDWFRERCSKRKAVEELYRQYFEHEAISAIGQKYDRSQIADTIDQYGFEYGKFVSMDWIAYPAPAGGKKQDRILAVCEPAFHACRVHITRDMEWFIKEEYEPFPKGKMDGFDCICNVIHVASPGGKVHVKTKETEHSRRIKMLKAGTFEPALSASKEEDWRQV